ncbi:MAG: alpha/beta hydrolase fold domain-containing protein [Actinomycetota bacterium]
MPRPRRHSTEPGWGTGPLSAQARARLARPATPALRPPPIDDRAAVAHWRSTVHQAWLDGDPAPEACGHRWGERAGVAVLAAGADVDDGSRPVVVYAHGGGFALGSAPVAVPITERLALGCEVVSVEYRLAPEHPFPAAVDDVAAVVEAVATETRGRSLILAGDSAGANLALAVAQRRRAAPGPIALAGLVLLSPQLDLEPETARPASERDDVDEVAGRWLRAAYCGGVEPDDPGPSPLRGPLDGLPPSLVQAGSEDSALPSAIRLARAARLAGVAVELDLWSGLWHAWHYHRDLPEADRALAHVVAFCRHLAAGGARLSPAGQGPG